MAFLSDTVLDGGLNAISNATGLELHVCSIQPTTRAATLTSTLGNKAAPATSGPADGSPDGRAVTVAAVTDGSITAGGTASHWALIDGTSLIASNSLTASQVVTSGNTFSLTAITIRIPDAV